MQHFQIGHEDHTRVASPAGPARDPGLRPAPTLTLVIPCYNEEPVMPALLDRLDRLERDLAATGRISGAMRILMIDDGSTDGTWAAICAAGEGRAVTGLRLSCNSGHQTALLAGLMQADTDVVVSMDADLQDDPDAVGPMIDAWARGAEIVFGVRASRATDTGFKRRSARTYYRLLNWLGADIVPDHADYRLMSRKALTGLASFGERNLFLRGLVRKLGFRQEIVTYDRSPRVAGESKYPLGKMIALALEGITSLSVRPLRLISWAGFAVAAIAFAAGLWSVTAWALGIAVPGWASTVLPIYLLGGMHLVALGIIGEYVGKIYLETKARPRYLIDELHRPATGAQTIGLATATTTLAEVAA